jgi:hypothetical protein
VITIYTYRGKFGTDDLPADYIPCLVGTNSEGEDAYFESLCEIAAADILLTKRSQWVDHPVLIVSVKFILNGTMQLGYATADDLMTAGVNF